MSRGSERRIRVGQCERKARYQSRGEAEGMLFVLQFDGNAKGDQQVYHCPHCASWHYGRPS